MERYHFWETTQKRSVHSTLENNTSGSYQWKHENKPQNWSECMFLSHLQAITE